MVVVEEKNSTEDQCPVVGKREKAHTRPIVNVFAFQSSGGDVGVITVAHDSVKLWRVDEGDSDVIALTERSEVKKWRCGIQAADASRDGKCIVVVGIDSILYEILIGDEGPIVTQHDFGYMETWHIKIAKNNLNYITTSFSGNLVEIDLQGKISKKEPFQNVKTVSSIAYSNRSDMVAVANNEGLVMLVETETLKVVSNFEVHAMKIRTMAFANNDEFLLTGSDDKTLRLYQVSGDRPGLIRQYCGSRSAILCAVFDQSSAGARFASCDATGEIFIWDVNESSPMHVLKSIHEGAVNSIAFSPTGRHLFAVGEDKQISCHKIPQMSGFDIDSRQDREEEIMDYEEASRGDGPVEDEDIDV